LAHLLHEEFHPAPAGLAPGEAYCRLAAG